MFSMEVIKQPSATNKAVLTMPLFACSAFEYEQSSASSLGPLHFHLLRPVISTSVAGLVL